MLGSQPGCPGLARPFLPRALPGHLSRHILSSVCSAGVPSLPFPSPAGPHMPADPQTSPLQVQVLCWPWGPQAPWHFPQLAGTRVGIRRRNRSRASPQGMLFPTVLPPCRGMSVGTPLPRAGPLCGEGRCCGVVPAVGATPARPCPCPCQSPGEAAAASAALTQLNPAQQHEMETRHPECQLGAKERVGF